MFKIILMVILKPARKKTREIVSVGNDSLIKVYSKQPVIRVIIFTAEVGIPS